MAPAEQSAPQPAHPASDWEQRYRQGDTGWDLGEPSPALRWWLGRQPAPPAGAVALVPGCGSGHELPLLAAAGYRVLGVDVADSALSAARSRPAATPDPRIELIRADALRDASAIPAGSIDVVFDQTFFCAIHPDERGLWSAAIDRWLGPAGELWMLHLRTDHLDRPPYDSSPQQVRTQLATAGLRIFDEHDLAGISHPRWRGRERFLQAGRRGTA